MPGASGVGSVIWGVDDMNAGRFFCWRPASIMLWVFGVVFALFAVANLWLLTKAGVGAIEDSSLGDSRRLARVLERGSIENGMIAVLCVVGWFFMRRRTQSALFAGAFAVAGGLFITSYRWLYWEIKGPNPLSWAEPLLVWPFLLYAFIYAYREGRQIGIAAPGGPAKGSQPIRSETNTTSSVAGPRP